MWSTSSTLTGVATVTAVITRLVPTKAATPRSPLLWSEEFDSDAIGRQPVNTSVWSFDLGNGGWGNDEYQTYTNSIENAYLQNGTLHIVAHKEKDGSFSSARIHTRNKLWIQYGTLQVRAKIPDTTGGLWPAVWTMGQNFDAVGWPTAGEMDLLEVGNGNAASHGYSNQQVIAGLHYTETVASSNRTYNANNFNAYNVPKRLDTDFHVYTLDWTPTYVKMSVDGAQVHFSNLGWCGASCKRTFTSQAHALILNLAIGGHFTREPGDARGAERISADFPATFEVDWIRLYDIPYGNVRAQVTTAAETVTNTTMGANAASNVATSSPVSSRTLTPSEASIPPTRSPVSPVPTSASPVTNATSIIDDLEVTNTPTPWPENLSAYPTRPPANNIVLPLAGDDLPKPQYLSSSRSPSSTSPAVAPIPSNTTQITTTPAFFPVAGAMCGANPACHALNLTGACCPTVDDWTLGCCTSSDESTTTITMAEFLEPTCVRNKACAGLDGACCPTNDGRYLDCCSVLPNECFYSSENTVPNKSADESNNDMIGSCEVYSTEQYRQDLAEAARSWSMPVRTVGARILWIGVALNWMLV